MTVPSRGAVSGSVMLKAHGGALLVWDLLDLLTLSQQTTSYFHYKMKLASTWPFSLSHLSCSDPRSDTHWYF